MSKKLSESEKEDYRQAFAVVDTDKDGFISIVELETAMICVGQNTTPYELRELVEKVGVYQDGKINFKNFLAILAANVKDIGNESTIREALRVLDRDGSGRIPAADLKAALTSTGEHLTHEEVEAMIQSVGVDEDGRVLYEDLVKLMTRRKQKSSK